MNIEIPKFDVLELNQKINKYCLCIPVINEGELIDKELKRIKAANIDKMVDIIICDGGSTDGSLEKNKLVKLGINTLLTKKDSGKLSAQLRMGYYYALSRGYEGIITVDGNNKDSVESVPLFIEKLEEGYDLIQGSRFIKGGQAVNTPLIRFLSVRLIHAPVISLAARQWFTDTTNGYRGYSKKYLEHPDVQPFRKIFSTYELLAYLSVRATRIGLKATEVPVARVYPKTGKTPTKISAISGNLDLLKTLWNTLIGKYNPKI